MRGENTDGRQDVLGSHTIQTYGVRLARKHLHDWVVLILLGAVVIALHYAAPFSRFIGKGMMTDISYTVKQSTVPAWGVPIISIVCPIVIFVSIYIARRDVYDLHHAMLGVLYAVLITAVVTTVVKNAVGRPRPDFFWRCFPDGKQSGSLCCMFFCLFGMIVVMSGKYLVNTTSIFYMKNWQIICICFLSTSRQCFTKTILPGSFAGLGFLSLYLSGKIKVFDHQGHVAKLCITILPLLIASLVGFSGIDNYRHHWEDVFVGGLLGFITAIPCYLYFFPPPYHHQGWGPYAYFDMLEELQVASSNNAQRQHSACGHHVGVSGEDHSRTSRNDLEAGRV